MGRIFKEAAETVFKRHNVKGARFVWGGDYKTIKDRPHFEIKLFNDLVFSNKPEKYENKT